MTAVSRKAVLVCIAGVIAAAFAFGVAASPPDRRVWALLLIIATTLLTCSSVAGYFFLRLFLGHALSVGATLRGRWVALALAAIAFAISFGSGAFLSYLLKHT
jgi:hypothetical protein